MLNAGARARFARTRIIIARIDVRILYISDSLPYPLYGGTAVRYYNLLRRIAAQNEVWLITFLDATGESVDLAPLQKFLQHVETVKLPHHDHVAYVPGLIQYGLQGKPFELSFYHSDELTRRIGELTTQVDFDLAEIVHSHMALYRDALAPRLYAKSILTFIDVQFQKSQRISRIARQPDKKLRAWIYAKMMRRWEPTYADHFGRCIVMSETDRHLLLGVNPGLRVRVVPNGVDTHAYQPLTQNGASASLIFIGSMHYGPCVDAALFFCNEVLPRLRQKVGAVEFWIVGKNPSRAVNALNGNGVHVTGRVDDPVPYYQHSTVCVVPLRAGGGTRLKILEAMALGRPVVSTTLGCEGLDVVDGEHLLIADDPEQFAAQTARLLNDAALYARLVANARQLVVARYDWDTIAHDLQNVYAELAQAEKP